MEEIGAVRSLGTKWTFVVDGGGTLSTDLFDSRGEAEEAGKAFAMNQGKRNIIAKGPVESALSAAEIAMRIGRGGGGIG